MSLSVDPTTKRTTTSGFQYDAKGNLTNLPNVSGALSYDIENRTGSTNSLYSNLACDMENQPLDRGGQWNLYGLNGERLGTYTYTFGRNVTYINGVDYDTTPVYPAQASRNIYFGGRLIQSNNTTVVVDAQGSVRANESGQTFEFYPYGEEMGSGTTNGREKFATYTRESNGLDYADQRYYSSTYGAFTSADPLHQTATTPADPNNPGSWNRFAYTAADPINRFDPSGTSNCAVDSFDSGDSDDSHVNLGSNCGSGFEPGGDLPNGATRCHSRPGLIFTFNGVPSTCEDGIIIAVDTSHVAPPTCDPGFLADNLLFQGEDGLVFSGADIDIGARTIFGESSGNSQENSAIASVIDNRVDNPLFGRLTTITQVVNVRCQFAAVAPCSIPGASSGPNQPFIQSQPGLYQTLGPVACQNLANDVSAMLSTIEFGPTYSFTSFRMAGSTNHSGTVIGGNIFW